MLKRLTVIALLLVLGSFVPAWAADVMNFVPADCSLVMQMNITKAMNEPFVKQKIEGFLANQTPEAKKTFEDFLAKSGVDPYKSFQTLTAYVPGTTDPKNPNAGAFLSGNIDSAKFLKAVSEQEKSAVEKLEGVEVVKLPSSGQLFAALETGLLFVGAEAELKAVLEVKGGKTKAVATNESLGVLLKKVDTNALVWGAGLINKEMKDQAKANPQVAALADLDSLFVALNLEKGVALLAEAGTTKKEAAAATVKVVNDLIAIGKPLADQIPEMGEVFKLIKVAEGEKTVKLTLNVPQDKFDALKKKLEEMAKSAAPAAPAAGTPSEEAKPE